MDDNKNLFRFLIATAVLVGVYFLINLQFGPKTNSVAHVSESPVTTPNLLATVSSQSLATSSPTVLPAQIADAPSNGTAGNSLTSQIAGLLPAKTEDLTLNLSSSKIVFSRLGACINAFDLMGFKRNLASDTAVPLFENYGDCKAYGVKVGETDFRAKPTLVFKSASDQIVLVQDSESFLVFKSFSFKPESYVGELEIKVINKSPVFQKSILSLELGATSEHVSAGSMISGVNLANTSIAYFHEDKTHRTHLTFEKSPTPSSLESKIDLRPKWIGSDSLYFLAALIPQFSDPLKLDILMTGYNFKASPNSEPDRTGYEGWLGLPVELSPGTEKSWTFTTYFGPKTKAALDTLADYKLSDSIDYGFFKVVAWPMFFTLKFLHHWIGNWGLSIVLLTIIIKILFIPLTLKAYIAGKKMQKLQPQITKIKEKHKDGDKKLEQQEIMQLMTKDGSNPISGCLPILPQIPVFFGLNSVLMHTFELRQAPFYFWFKDLATRDPLFISPAIMAILMYFQQKMTPMPSMDPAQAKMMQFLPIVFAIFMFSYPSGLVLYIITNTLATMIQQQYMMKKYKDL